MASIELVDISHTYDPPEVPESEKDYAVRDLSIVWEDGTANALLGPSGCGKTTLLNIISGLLVPSKGRILVDGNDVTGIPARERKVAQVFQFPVVYASMNVFDNLAFPLRNQGMEEGLVRDKVDWVADLLGLTDSLKSAPGALNPAEKQRISLGRGIVREDTTAVLLDEPLTVIDPKLKWGLRRMLKQVQRDTEKTMIYVTHDQQEALTFADDVTIVRDGRLVQKGSPDELHSEPATPFIGYFIGSPGMNILDFGLKDSRMTFESFSLPVPEAFSRELSQASGRLQLGIRPEFVTVRAKGEGGEDRVPFEVKIIEDTGAYRILTLGSGETRIKARVGEGLAVEEGGEVDVSFPPEEIKLFADEVKIN